MEVKKCGRRYGSIDTDTVTGPEIRPAVRIFFYFVLITVPGLTARFLLIVWLINIRAARRICKSSVHGAVEKAGWGSSEKKLPSKTAERHIVSASSMRKRCEFDGPCAKGV